jgi:hypothetical protein
VRGNELHTLDQVRAEDALLVSGFLPHFIALLSDWPRSAAVPSLVRGRARFDVLRVAADQGNAGSQHNVDVDDSGAATFSFAVPISSVASAPVLGPCKLVLFPANRSLTLAARCHAWLARRSRTKH